MTNRIDVKILQICGRLKRPLLLDERAEGHQKLASATVVVIQQWPYELVDEGDQSYRRLLLEEASESGQALRAGNFPETACETERCASFPNATRNLGHLNRASMPADQAEITSRVVNRVRASRDYEGRFGGVSDECAG